MMKGFVSAMIIALASVFMAFPASAQDMGDDDCSMYTATAGDVKNDDESQENKDNLESFVLNAKCTLEKVKTINAFLTQLAKFRNEENWNVNGVYLFIFEKPEKETPDPVVLFNANNPELEDYNLNIEDHSQPAQNVADVINRSLEEDGFSTYTWDDPRFEGDEKDEQGKSPGTSEKISYASTVTLDLFGPKETFIIGSGFYPNAPPIMDSDDGCAIASASTHKSAALMLNLFLIVSALFLAVSWKNRSDGK